jgi:hypothetical protein
MSGTELLPLVTTSAIAAAVLADKIPPWISAFRKWYWTKLCDEQSIDIMVNDAGKVAIARMMQFVHALIQRSRAASPDWEKKYSEWHMMRLQPQGCIYIPKDWMSFTIPVTITEVVDHKQHVFTVPVPIRLRVIVDYQSSIIGFSCWTDRSFWCFCNAFCSIYHFHLMKEVLETVINTDDSNAQFLNWLSDLLLYKASQASTRQSYLMENMSKKMKKKWQTQTVDLPVIPEVPLAAASFGDEGIPQATQATQATTCHTQATQATTCHTQATQVVEDTSARDAAAALALTLQHHNDASPPHHHAPEEDDFEFGCAEVTQVASI